MTKQVRESAPAQRIGAYVIQRADRNRTTVAIVQVLYPADGAGRLKVDIWHAAGPTADKRSAAKEWGPEQCSADGYGYDKLTAALAGVEIDGHRLVDHCGEAKKAPKAGGWARDAKCPKGYSFANWDREAQLYRSCHKASGWDFLRAHGYRIISAI